MAIHTMGDIGIAYYCAFSNPDPNRCNFLATEGERLVFLTSLLMSRIQYGEVVLFGDSAGLARVNSAMGEYIGNDAFRSLAPQRITVLGWDDDPLAKHAGVFWSTIAKYRAVEKLFDDLCVCDDRGRVLYNYGAIIDLDAVQWKLPTPDFLNQRHGFCGGYREPFWHPYQLMRQDKDWKAFFGTVWSMMGLKLDGLDMDRRPLNTCRMHFSSGSAVTVVRRYFECAFDAWNSDAFKVLRDAAPVPMYQNPNNRTPSSPKTAALEVLGVEQLGLGFIMPEIAGSAHEAVYNQGSNWEIPGSVRSPSVFHLWNAKGTVNEHMPTLRRIIGNSLNILGFKDVLPAYGFGLTFLDEVLDDHILVKIL